MQNSGNRYARAVSAIAQVVAGHLIGPMAEIAVQYATIDKSEYMKRIILSIPVSAFSIMHNATLNGYPIPSNINIHFLSRYFSIINVTVTYENAFTAETLCSYSDYVIDWRRFFKSSTKQKITDNINSALGPNFIRDPSVNTMIEALFAQIKQAYDSAPELPIYLEPRL